MDVNTLSLSISLPLCQLRLSALHSHDLKALLGQRLIGERLAMARAQWLAGAPERLLLLKGSPPAAAAAGAAVAAMALGSFSLTGTLGRHLLPPHLMIFSSVNLSSVDPGYLTCVVPGVSSLFTYRGVSASSYPLVSEMEVPSHLAGSALFQKQE